jgi:hypothetical protein
MNWWDILKSAKGSSKVSSKGKGTSFDASKIKVNIKDDESCVEKFNKIYKYINDEINRIIKTTNLRSDVNDFDYNNHSNGWIWFAFTDKELRDASGDNEETYKVLAELEYINYEAENEEAACKSLKRISELNTRMEKDNYAEVDGFYFTRNLNNLDIANRMEQLINDNDGGLIQMHFSIINPKVHKHYRKSIQMKPSLKAELKKLADSFDKLFDTAIQMAKDAVREKGL